MRTFCTTQHTCLHSAPVHVDIMYNTIHVCTQHQCMRTFCTTRHTCLHSAPVHVDILYNKSENHTKCIFLNLHETQLQNGTELIHARRAISLQSGQVEEQNEPVWYDNAFLGSLRLQSGQVEEQNEPVWYDNAFLGSLRQLRMSVSKFSTAVKQCELAASFTIIASTSSSFLHTCTQQNKLYHSVTSQKQTDRHLFNGVFSRTAWVSRNQKGYLNLDVNKATDDRMEVASARSYANKLQLAPDRQPRQVSTSLVNFLQAGCSS